MQTPIPSDLTNLAVLFSPAIAAPIVRYSANTFAARFGGPRAWYGLVLSFLIEGGLALVLYSPITAEVVARGVLYSIFAFVGAFGLNEYIAAQKFIESEPEQSRMVSGAPKTKPVLPPGSWIV